MTLPASLDPRPTVSAVSAKPVTNTSASGRFFRRIISFGLVGAALVGAGALVKQRQNEKSKNAEAAPAVEATTVTTATVVPRALKREVKVVGSLYGRDEVSMTAKVEGRVLKIHKDLSDVVKPGDVLLELDATDFRLAAAEAKRSLELELARIGLKEIPKAGEFKVNEVPTVVRALAQERNAVARRERVMRVSGGASTADERDSAQAEFEVARANYQLAVLDAEAILASARFRQAALETLEQRIKDTKIVAPTPSGDGRNSAEIEYVVAKRGVVEGEMVRTMPGDNTVLFKLIIRNPLKLQATVPERFLSDVKLGQEALLEVESFPGRPFAGKVTRISPIVDRASRTFQVEIAVPNDSKELFPGSFAKVAIQTRIDANALTVPEESVISFAGVQKVIAIRNGVAHEVPVTLGEGIESRDGTRRRMWVEVTGQLKAGDVIATSGHSQLAEGSAVKVRETASVDAKESKGAK